MDEAAASASRIDDAIADSQGQAAREAGRKISAQLTGERLPTWILRPLQLRCAVLPCNW